MMNICLRVTVNTSDYQKAKLIVNEMMENNFEGVIGWGFHKNKDKCCDTCSNCKCSVDRNAIYLTDEGDV